MAKKPESHFLFCFLALRTLDFNLRILDFGLTRATHFLLEV